MTTPRHGHVLVTGGAGYVGSALLPKLLGAGHAVTVLDLYLYGGDIFGALSGQTRLREVRGDIRDPAAVADALAGCDAVVHLACISNDPSLPIRLTPMTATCRVPPLSRVKLGIGWSRGVARDAEQ